VLDTIKKFVEALGLIPTILGYFNLTPQWFRPSPFFEPLIEYIAAFVALVVFVITVVFSKGVPPTIWRAERNRYFVAVFLAFVGSLATGALYVWLVRSYPQASTGLDILQMGLWAAFFGLASFVFTALACLFKRA
jgi:hypothetical protein